MFQRSMRRLGALLITLSGITPAASVFIMGSDVIREAGTGAVICFAVTASFKMTAAAFCATLEFEWEKALSAPASRSGRFYERGFESHPLRQKAN